MDSLHTRLANEFSDIYNRVYREGGDIFNIATAYIDTCYTEAERLLPRNRGEAITISDWKHQSLSTYISLEYSTWVLLYCLYDLRLNKHEPVQLSGIFKTAFDLTNIMRVQDINIREQLVVKTWLEETFRPQAGELIKEKGETVVPSDINFRIDDKAWGDLCYQLWVSERAGLHAEAIARCQKSHQPWRAAVFLGSHFRSIPRLEDTELPDHFPTGTDIPGDYGNADRAFFKFTLLRILEENRKRITLNTYEAALYGLQAGSVDDMIPVCNTWHDMFWSRVSCNIDILLDQKLASYPPQLLDLPVDSDVLTSLSQRKTESWDEIFSSLSKNPKLQEESKQPFLIVQTYIVKNDIEGAIRFLYDEITNPQNSNQSPGSQANSMFFRDNAIATNISPSLFRFGVHLIMFFRDAQLFPYDKQNATINQREHAKKIISEYINLLIQSSQYTLIAMYTAQLPNLAEEDRHLRAQTYADFLSGVADKDDREKYLNLANEYGLDIPAITRLVADKVVNTKQAFLKIDKNIPFLEYSVSAEDEAKIKALEWLCYDPEQQLEALQLANSLVRSFLLSGKLSAAQRTYERLTELQGIVPNIPPELGLASNFSDLDSALLERVCLSEFLTCSYQYAEWVKHYHKKPVDGFPSLTSASPGDTEAALNKHKYWKIKFDALTSEVILWTTKILQSPGGWLIKLSAFADTRGRELSKVRSECIPQLVINLHDVLMKTNQFFESLQIANLVADERYKVYTAFDKDELKRIMLLLRHSAISLLDKAAKTQKKVRAEPRKIFS